MQFIIRNLPNEISLASPDPINLQWWGDASSSFSVGVTIGSHWAVWKWAPGFIVGPRQSYNIGWAEAVAVELGLRLAIDLNLFSATSHQGCSFLVRSDNAGIVAVTNKGWSCSCETNKILKHVDEFTQQILSYGLLFSTFYRFPYTAGPPTSTAPT